MQSWGSMSRHRQRDTGIEPSKSGVVGLLAAALGRGRDQPIDDLAGLRMGVRIDREGLVASDYHTVGGSAKVAADLITLRHYLADASFLVALEGDRAFLESIHLALRRPRWALFLGRRAFVPSAPVAMPDDEPWGPGVREADLESALRGYPWRWADERPDRDRPARLRLVLEVPFGESVRQDVPLSFHPDRRSFATRTVTTSWLPVSELSA